MVDYLVAEKGFVHCSARALWVDEIQKRGLEANRANMRIVANSLRAERGDDYLVQEYLRRAREEGWKDFVIESLRAIAEAETLKKNGGVLFAVDADPKVRYARIQERASESDQVTFDEFIAHEQLEMNDPDPHGMQKEKVIALADYVITNNGTLEELRARVDEILAKMGV